MQSYGTEIYIKNTKEAQTLLYAVCYYNKERIKVSTGQKIHTEAWSTKMQRCEVGNMYADRINRLSRKTNKILDLIADKWNNNKNLKEFVPGANYTQYNSTHYIKYHLTRIIKAVTEGEKQEEEKKQIRPLEYFENYVNEMTSRVDPHTGRFIGERTQVHHRTVLHRIKEFMRYSGISDSFTSFNDQFEYMFKRWAYTSKGYRQNTIPATFSVLKVWLNAAAKEGLITSDRYKSYPSKGTDVDNIYLTEEEITAIYDLDIQALKERGEIDAKSTMEITRDLFVIGCWTGLRRSDLNHLDNALFDLDKELITIVTEKTGEEVTIPMHRYIKELWYKYDGKFPHLGNKTTAGRHLPELGRHAKIDSEVIVKENRGGKILSHKYKKYQLIKFHTARRSFATNLFLKGAPTIKIMKLTGHTTEKNFLKYIKVTREENAESMKQYFK